VPFWGPLTRRALSRAAPTQAPTAGRARFTLDASGDLLAAWSASLVDTPVSRAEALQVPAVLRSRNLIAGTIATLPLVCRDAGRRVVPRALLDQPEAVTTRAVTVGHTVADLLFEGIAWWRVVEREPAGLGQVGYPWRVMRLDPSIVTVPQTSQPLTQGSFTEQPVPYGPAHVNGERVPDGDIIRFDSPLPPLLRHAARAIRTILKLDAAAANYAANPMPLDIYTPTDGADPADDDDIAAFLADLQLARQTRSSAYIPAALHREQAMPMTSEQMQLAESRQHAVLEIARACGIDPEDLGVSTTSRTYQNAVDRRLDLIAFTLAPFLHAIEQRLTLGDVTPPGQHVRFDVAELERPNALARYQAYEVGLRVGAITEEEIRAAEDRPSLPKPPPVPAQQPAPAPARQSDEPALTFAHDSGITFDLPSVAESFKVDAHARTITGLVVPYGPVARSGFSRWRFQPGSLKYADVKRVKLLRDHDASQALGVAVKATETAAGMVATFKVARGEAGDQALALAEDGVLDGFSVGIDFEADGWVPDPADDGVRLVQAAAWRETSLTALPAFDSARVASVTAATPGRDLTMSVTAPEQTAPAAPAPAPDTTAFAAAMEQAVTAALQKFASAGPTPVPSAHPGGPVQPQARPGALHLSVTEPPVYRFSRAKGHSLVRDLWKARTEGDVEAMARLAKFRAQQEDIASKVELTKETFELSPGVEFTTGTRANISQVIPPGYRPEFYVPQLFQGRPIIDNISRGVIDDATQFSIPKFGTATGLSAAGTEGSNPADGTITASTVTVAPATAVGLFKVTRELVDAANPAIDAIALQAMQEAYSQDVEGRAYAKINSANGVAGVITSGFVPSGAAVATATGAGAGLSDDGVALIRTLRQQLTAYPFRRFAPVTRGLVSAEGATLLTSAEDTTGRPLLPPVSPMNSAGTMDGNGTPTQGWNLDGLAVKPAWSMTGNAAGDPDSLLFNHNDVWCWESPLLMFRYEERNGPALIELAIFGYFAVEILRASGFSAVRVTAVP
jgi:HK97 family phage prohead protease